MCVGVGVGVCVCVNIISITFDLPTERQGKKKRNTMLSSQFDTRNESRKRRNNISLIEIERPNFGEIPLLQENHHSRRVPRYSCINMGITIRGVRGGSPFVASFRKVHMSQILYINTNTYMHM